MSSALNVDCDGDGHVGDAELRIYSAEGQDDCDGRAGDDSIAINSSADNADVTGLSAAVAISHAEFANDRLDISTLEGDDAVDTTGLAAGVIQVFVDGVPV